MSNPWLASLILAAAATVNVSLWTLRVTLAARSRRMPAATVAALEAVLFTFAFSHVSENLDSPSRVAGYAAGVAAGTYLGMVLDRRIPAAPSSPSHLRMGRNAVASRRGHVVGGPPGPGANHRAQNGPHVLDLGPQRSEMARHR